MICNRVVLVKASVSVAHCRLSPERKPNCPSVPDQYVPLLASGTSWVTELFNNPNSLATVTTLLSRRVVLRKIQIRTSPTGASHQPVSRALLLTGLTGDRGKRSATSVAKRSGAGKAGRGAAP